jgi:Fic family protein
MNSNRNFRATDRPAGYHELIQRYSLDVIPNWHISFVATHGSRNKKINGKSVEEVFSRTYWPGETDINHLEFALKYDGINLAILKILFLKIDEKELVNYIKAKNTGKYARSLWFLFEFLTGKILPIDNLMKGNYFDLLDPGEYYTASPAIKIPRQRINNNLLGGRDFCPIIRRTDILNKFEKKDFSTRCSSVLSGYSQELLKRALGYLYAKETRSSFEIENIKPSSSRIGRFIALLQSAEKRDFCQKERLIEIQNSIVDPRFQDSGYRKNQNYVGETVAVNKERIHYISPKPGDLPDLMKGLIYSHEIMKKGPLLPVIHAAAISYGFVYLHPFEDGNGRIHRFLIHNILALRGFTPKGFIFPVSATMLENPEDYDSSLEAFSNVLLPLIEYTLDENGGLTVHSKTAVWYQYMDITSQAEYLYGFIEKTIEKALIDELEFLANYDKTKKAIQNIIDMPDRKIDQFISFCLQNNGHLSKKKHKDFFDFLNEEELSLMENAVVTNYQGLI